ncbi:carbohydrate ABC transporter permease [Demequina sediminicola]|uniref:carbohydrate ABC transporter permease n=1 Tax=Demequina sediminicola TaxID=1095026 RepID=UPI0007813866|nr:carbohydrate ABC transporter permease [Demequina sediminicola]
MATKTKSSHTIRNILTVLVAALWVFPVYWMINSSFQSSTDINALTPTWFPFPGGTLNNYTAVLDPQTGFGSAFRMSIMVTALSIVVCLVFAFLAAVAISRFKFRGRKSFVVAIILVQMLPAEAMFIAQYKMIAAMDLLNTVLGVSIIYVATVIPFTAWMLRGFVAGIPADLEEAAMVDGCTRFGAFMRVTFPLLAPGLVASSVFALIQVWNEYALASVLLQKDSAETLPLWLAGFSEPSLSGPVPWGQVMAGSVLVAIPVMIFFLIVQGRMTQGLVGGAVKG